MRQTLTRKSTIVKRYRKKQQELCTQELQLMNKKLAAKYNLDFLFNTAPKAECNEHGHIILDPNNPADRRWMED